MNVPTSKTETFMAFPQEKRDALAAAQAEKLKSIAHLPKKVNIPGFPNQVPIMTPVADQQQTRAQAPMTAQQHNMRGQQPMGAINVFVPDGQQVDPNVQADRMFGAFANVQHQPMAASIPKPLDQVPNVKPGFTAAIADPESMGLDLPSRFSYYAFKDFYAQPFRTKHIAKLQKAHREQSLLPVVEAVASVCFTTDQRFAGQPIAFDLSLPDFFFVLYWLRLNSFTKSNYVHTTKCDNEEHIKRVEYMLNMDEIIQQFATQQMSEEEFARIKAQALPATSLDISQIVTNTDLRINELETLPDPEIYHFSESSQMYLRPPTMRDVIEFAEAPEMANPETRAEYVFLGGLASHIQHRDMRLTLADRIQIVGEAAADDIALIKGFEKALGDYGVEEKIKVQCKECGAVRGTKLSIAAHSFFSAFQ
jgi:hypothetical protein